MEDFLTLPDDYESRANDGKKHVSLFSFALETIFLIISFSQVLIKYKNVQKQWHLCDKKQELNCWMAGRLSVFFAP